MQFYLVSLWIWKMACEEFNNGAYFDLSFISEYDWHFNDIATPLDKNQFDRNQI